MESIFHEKQEGSLCAQHCLNNLLQGEYFSPVELSSIAHQLDEEERMRMAEGGVTSEDYRTFLQPSGNMDDSGFFSIQVISNALKVWGLELILFNSPEYQRLGIEPINERSFICNYKEHWFTVRKLGKQWFNLNSLLTGPELISDTYLALFLAQLQQEGYSIFVVKGDLPDCEADQLLQMIRVQQMHRPKLIGEELAQLKEQSILKADLERVLAVTDGPGMLDEDEEELQRALALSRQEVDMEDEEADLRRAIQLSIQGGSRNVSHDIPQTSSTTLTSEELRKRREAYFEKRFQYIFTSECSRQQQQEVVPPGQLSYPCERPTTSSGGLRNDQAGNAMSEEDMLRAAVTMSLETVKDNLKAEGKK
ncbi:ataxin-3 isoform X3 [Nannospalax galili]|uniref:ataxin-3 isoform X3 n=1 Tax=Nannospalax galili TaxID=1026970 RepID=UPI00111C37DF|nr:ataxin-3 isoform X3 [Nannospalax galili]